MSLLTLIVVPSTLCHAGGGKADGAQSLGPVLGLSQVNKQTTKDGGGYQNEDGEGAEENGNQVELQDAAKDTGGPVGASNQDGALGHAQPGLAQDDPHGPHQVGVDADHLPDGDATSEVLSDDFLLASASEKLQKRRVSWSRILLARRIDLLTFKKRPRKTA